jgi:hypothetical protein
MTPSTPLTLVRRPSSEPEQVRKSESERFAALFKPSARDCERSKGVVLDSLWREGSEIMTLHIVLRKTAT